MKLYVPNPQKWVDFFERVRTGQTQLSQTGRGRRPHVITVDQSKPRPIKAILPAEQTAAQAKSELEREGINPTDVVKAFQLSTDRGRKRKATEAKRERGKRRKIDSIAIQSSTVRGHKRKATEAKTGKRRQTVSRPKTKASRSRQGYKDIFEIR